MDVPAENGCEVVPVGAVAYWPPGSKLCLFWGETPASVDDEPRAASPVNVVARLSDTSALEGSTAGREFGSSDSNSQERFSGR